jgi:hypothetical protein
MFFHNMNVSVELFEPPTNLVPLSDCKILGVMDVDIICTNFIPISFALLLWQKATYQRMKLEPCIAFVFMSIKSICAL